MGSNQTFMLAIDTSHTRGEICAIVQDKLVGPIQWEKQGSHSEVLTVKYAELLMNHQLRSCNLKKIYCVNGPGSFTGLRVGVNFAKSLAYASQCPIIPVNSLELLALACPHFDKPVLSVIDAQKNSVFASLFTQQNGNLVSSISNKVVPIRELDQLVRQPTYICGEGLERYRDFVCDDVSANLIQEEAWRLSSFIHYLFPKSVRPASRELPWTELQPLYLKKSSAEEKLST